MKIEAGKYYITNDNNVYGPADNRDKDRDVWIIPDQYGSNWGYTGDGLFIGGDRSHPRSIKSISMVDHQGNVISRDSAADKPIHEMVLDDYRRGIDAIWDQRHNLGI